METLALPITLPQTRIESVEYLSKFEHIFDIAEDLFYCADTKETIQQVADYVIVGKYE